MEKVIELLKKDVEKLETLQKELEVIANAFKKDRTCGCGESLFKHAGGTWECPSCEIF